MDDLTTRRPLGTLSSNTLNGRGKVEREIVNKRVIVNKRGSNDGKSQRGLMIIAKTLLHYSFKKWNNNIHSKTTTPSYADIISHGMTGNKETIFEVDDNISDGNITGGEEAHSIKQKQDIITPKKRRFYSDTDDDVVEINATTTPGGIRINMSNIGTPLTTASGGMRANNTSINIGTPLPLFGTIKNSSSHTTPSGTLQFPSTVNSTNRVDNKVNTPARASNLFENIDPNKFPAPLEKLIDENEINDDIEGAHSKPTVEKKEIPKPVSPQEVKEPTVADNNAAANGSVIEFPLAKDFEALHYAMVEATTASIKSLLLHHNARAGGTGSKFLQSRETVSYIETEYKEFSPNVDVKSVADSIKPVLLSPLGHQGQPSGATPYVPLCELSIYQEKLKLWQEKYGKEEKDDNSSDSSATDKTLVIDDANTEKAIEVPSL